MAAPRRQTGCLLATCLLACGCAAPPFFCGPDVVYNDVAERTGYDVAHVECDCDLQLPNGATLADGLTEEEAVLIALWNNALFQETLVELDLAMSDLVQAGLLPNPEFVYFFPASHKPFKYAFDLPLEALWLRPIRIEAADRESQCVSQRLSQAALDLIRDTRQAYADVLIASGRLQVAAEAMRLRQRIANAAKARLDAGDASPQEVSVTEVDVHLAQQDQARLRYDVELAQERLRNLMGLGDHRDPLVLAGGLPPNVGSLDADLLAHQAVSCRPDMLAANVAVAAADARVHLAEVGWIRVLGILDATSGTRTGHEFSPAVRATLPIFNCNEGAILRANAELQRALRQQQSLRDRIMLEVYQAYQRYEQARAELNVLDVQVMPEIETAIQQIETSFREGDVSYLVVLQASRQLLDSRARRHQLHGELRRAWAELERSVAQHIVSEASPETVEGIPVEEIPVGMEAADEEEQPPPCTIEAPSPD